MDLLDFAASDKPVFAPLFNPQTGTPLTHNGQPVEWGLYGPDSAVMVDYDRRKRQEMLDSLGSGGPVKPRLKLKADEIDSQTLDRLVMASAGWRNLSIGGETPAFSAEKAREILADPRLRWIGRQLETRLADEGNFLGIVESAPKK